MHRSRRNSKLPDRPERERVRHLAGEDLGWIGDDAQRMEQRFREEEAAMHDVPEPERTHQVESLQRLRDEMDGMLHDCRCLVSFDSWLAQPGREFLFDRFCRSAIGQWRPNVVPLVFRSGTETLERHLAHCPFCRIARRRQQGQARARELGLERLLRGDQIVEEFVEQTLVEAFFYARVPRGLLITLIPGGEGAPTKISVGGESFQTRNGDVLAIADLSGGFPNGLAEMNVLWQPADSAVHQSTGEHGYRNRLAFPNVDRPVAVVALSDRGLCRIPLILPREALEQGVVLRYCGRRLETSDSARLPSFAPLAPLRTVEPTTDADLRPPASRQRDPFEWDASGIAYSSIQVPVTVDAIFLKWPD